MRKSSPNRPTDSELEILRILWNRGPSTVREVHDVLNQAKPTGYTTVLKFMQIMADKALLRRAEAQVQRAHVYEASVPKETPLRQVSTLSQRVARDARGVSCGACENP